MRHHFLDHYWTIESPVHRLDPRLKIIISFITLLMVVITPNGRLLDFAFFLPLIFICLVISHLPAGAVLRRMLVILPPVIIIAISLPFMGSDPVYTFHVPFEMSITRTGLLHFASVILKAISAIWIMTLLTSTTSFRDILAGMKKLHFPSLLISLLGFIYRYIFLFIDELERLSMGRKSRSFGNRFWLSIKGFSWMISSLFIRSFERAERVFYAMCARGYKGEFNTLTEMKITDRDAVITIAFLMLVIVLKIMGRIYGTCY